MLSETKLKRCGDASYSQSASRKIRPHSFFSPNFWECARLLAPLLLLVSSEASGADDKPLWQIQRTLASKKYVDLTHEFAPGIPRWPGFPDEARKTIYWYDKRPDTLGSGFFSELFTHIGQWGTHVDPPAHF